MDASPVQLVRLGSDKLKPLPKMGKLLLYSGTELLQDIRLERGELTIGRRPDNDIRLDSLAVSGHHAKIRTIGSDSFLEDLNSTNGTLVNGQAVRKHVLEDGDKIDIAKFSFQYSKLTGAPSTCQLTAALTLLNSANAGQIIPLTKAVTTLGKPGALVVSIHRELGQFFIEQTEGGLRCLVNGVAIGNERHLLHDGDTLALHGNQFSVSIR
ncbi:FHA domain-containing protein [Chitinivorax sp. PXF-14]|uniref:FHA domain-containing protein n=1 Tax=Chitinivorax sp. PXF-14 TaxID=3230488 RepID=UPI0034661AB2